MSSACESVNVTTPSTPNEGSSNPSDIDFLISDVNQDGSVDVLDVVSLVDQILH